jgi:hypothetical protein
MDKNMPSPASMPRVHAQQKFRQKAAVDALNLRSVRTASVRVHTSETGKESTTKKVTKK